MALELSEVVGKIGGGGDVIRDGLGSGGYTGTAYYTLRTITVSRTSFVAAQVKHSAPGGNSYADPTPVIRITSGNTEISTMTTSVSRTNYEQPMRVTAVVDPGTYQIDFSPNRSGRDVPLRDLIVSIVPI